MTKLLTLFLSLFLLTQVNYGQSQVDSVSLAKKGIYKTFYDFMIGIPSDTSHFYIDSTLSENGKWAGTYFKTPRYADTKKSNKSIWGFSDGKKTYINYSNIFFEVFIDDEQFFFYGFAIPNRSQSDNISIAFGASGAIVHEATASAKAQKRKHKYIIDKQTGKIHESLGHMNKVKSKENKVQIIIYRLSENPHSDTIHFKVDSNEYAFISDSFLRLKATYTYRPMVISYIDNIGIEHSLLVHLNEDEPVFVSCTMKAKNEGITFMQVDKSIGIYASNKAKKAQEKRLKKERF